MTKKRRFPALIKDMGSCIFKKPFTQQYPFVNAQVPEGYRGKHVFYPEKCISCGLCARDCPAKAIELVDVSGKRMPKFFLDSCIFCNLCAEGCPREAIKLSTTFEMSTTDPKELSVNPEDFLSKKVTDPKEESKNVV